MITSIIVDTTEIKDYYAGRIIDELEGIDGATINVEYEYVSEDGEPLINAVEISGDLTEEDINAIYAVAEEWGGEIISG